MQVKRILPNRGSIYHFPYSNTAQLMTKLEHYAALYAANNVSRRNVRSWTIPLRALVAFFKSYLLKKGFLYGFEGLLISSYNAMGVLVKYAKLVELRRQQHFGLVIEINPDKNEILELVAQLNQQEYLPSAIVLVYSGKTQNNMVQNLDELCEIVQSSCIIPSYILVRQEISLKLELERFLGLNPSVTKLLVCANPAHLTTTTYLKTIRNQLLSGSKGSKLDTLILFPPATHEA